MSRHKIVPLFALAVLAQPSCGKKHKSNNDGGDAAGPGARRGADGSGLKVTGTIAVTPNLADTGTPNQAWAFPLIKGAARFDGMSMVKQAPLDANGKFSFDFDTSGNASDYVVLLVDTTKPAGKQFVNFVGLPTDGDANLLNLPLAKAAGTLDAGRVETNPDGLDAKAQVSAAASADTLGITPDMADQFANTGNVLHVIKNLVNNCDAKPDGKCVNAQTTFQWNGKAGPMVGDFNKPTDWAYGGYSFIFGFHGTSYAFKDVCKASDAVKLTFFPPTDLHGKMSNGTAVTIPAATGISTEGFTTAETSGFGGQQCKYTGSGLSPAYVGDNGSFFNFIPISGPSIPEPLAAGDWKVLATGPNGLSEEYHFDLAAASPIDAKGVARVWTPAVKLTVDPNTNFVTKVEMKFYTYNPASGWQETTDTTAFLAAIGGAGTDGNTGDGGVNFLFDYTPDGGSRTNESILMKQVPGTNVFAAEGFKHNWELPAANGSTCAAGHLCAGQRISYTIRGVQINFSVDGR